MPSCARRSAVSFGACARIRSDQDHCIWRIFPGIIHIFFSSTKKKRKKNVTKTKKMKQSWQPKCTSSSPHLLCFSHPQLELASFSPSLSLTLSLSFSLSPSLFLFLLFVTLFLSSPLSVSVSLSVPLSESLSLSLSPSLPAGASHLHQMGVLIRKFLVQTLK